MPKLVVFRGDDVEKEVPLKGTTLRIGRHEQNDVVLDDSENGVSRYHAELRFENGKYVIVDRRSRNGIYINKRRIKDKAVLTTGVPVTIGAFELTLEDDGSTGDFDVPPVNAPTPGVAPGAGKPNAGRAPSPRTGGTMPQPSRQQLLLWGGLTAAVLLIAIVTFAVVRYMTRQPVPVATVSTTTTTADPPPPPGDPNKEEVAQRIASARELIDAKNYRGALDEQLARVLELEPENADALAMKKEAEDAIAAAAATVASNKNNKKVDPPNDPPEDFGIPRKPNEGRDDYLARAGRIKNELAEGQRSLEKNDYVTALNHFRTVNREQPRYQGVDLLIADAIDRQQKALESAMIGGQQNEQAGRLREARQFYLHALTIDPSSAQARTRAGEMLARTTATANGLMIKASTAEKIGEPDAAAGFYRQVIDLLLPGDELRDKATKSLEALKR